MQVIAGPRQVGKTTLVRQVLARIEIPSRYASSDEPTLRGSDWIAQQWDAARVQSRSVGPVVLVLDEVQKITAWSETVKRHWDEDTAHGTPIHVVLLGSAPLLIARGMSESLAGRFELLRLGHWSYAEMRDAFGLSLDQYVYHGGYPGAAPLIADWRRWRSYLLESLIETTIARDVLLLSRVDKPALLRRLFELACRYSGQELSYNKMLGQLQDAGNTTTLANYLDLLTGAGLVSGLQKFATDTARRRASSPKLQVLNTGLMSAMADLSPEHAQDDREYWGHLLESAVGAHLANHWLAKDFELYYWRRGDHEVDFVVRTGKFVTAIEVKSGRTSGARRGLKEFSNAFAVDRRLLVGGDGIPVDEFLSRSAVDWISP